MLDCGCNCGGYLFWTKDLGAGRCFGFDARAQWIEQAEFLAKQRGPANADVRFAVASLDQVPALGLEPFEVTLFNGLLYHLANPIRGLEIAAGLTRELLIVSSAARPGLPDGLLRAGYESPEDSTSGIDRLKWTPTGPRVIFAILAWLGFRELRCTLWRPAHDLRFDRVQVIGARREGAFAGFDASHMQGAEEVVAIVRTTVPPRATVLVASGGDDAYLRIPGRQGRQFPDDAAHDRDRSLTRHLEDLRTDGAGYLVVPAISFDRIAREPGFESHLETRYAVVHRDARCVIWDLANPRA